MSWKSEDLWQKARLYFCRAYAVTREDPLFPLWSSLALEMLARASVAKIHPVLLADPQQGENILHACGFPSPTAPKSVPVKTVFHRLKVVLPGFTEDDFKFCTALMEMRNAELHSGDLPFDKYPAVKWFPQLCCVAKMLTEFCGKSLVDLLGADEARAAEEMIKGIKEKLHGEVARMVKVSGDAYKALPPEEKAARAKEAIPRFIEAMDWKSKRCKCPSCGESGILHGEVVKTLEAKATKDGIEEQSVIMPRSFKCIVCGLTLPTVQHLLIANMADHFTVGTIADPKDYYGIEFDPSDYYEEDYGND